ncbi:MAG: bifunctional oligoribonuclease/PAP phosphatase NrnA [Lachnospiraceae bacterium]|nr:bifunctional oligoribonuclease/PAP phosphatase NrnA [Lachnospiraceae bacterium]
MGIEEMVRDADSIGISGHIRPDGDCVGASMAMYLYLKKVFPEKRIEIFLEKPSEVFGCIRDIGSIRTEYKAEEVTEELGSFDVFIAMDAPGDRLGEAQKLYEGAAKRINIDHHISNKGSGDTNCIDPGASSTSELVYGLLDQEKLDEEIAKAIYIGIIHDTGVFQYSNTSPRTMAVAGKLMAFGFNFSEIVEKTFYEKTYVQGLLLGRAMLESILFMDGRCIVSGIEKKTLDFYHADSGDLEGIVSHLNRTKGVECAIFMYQTGVLEYKVSLRSKGKVDVAAIAMYFGGGGHVRAAGCTMNGTFHDVANNLSLHIERQLKQAQEIG